MAEQQPSKDQTDESSAVKHKIAERVHTIGSGPTVEFPTPGSEMIKLYDLQSSIKDKINESTKRDTEFYDIAEPYDVLKELNVQVTPQLEEIDFYGGDRIPDMEYMPWSVESYIKIEKQRKDKKRRQIQLPEILNNFHKGQICFVGPAGSGKTTLLKAISRDVMRKDEEKYENLKNIEIVHFVKCRGFRANDTVTPAELLFRNLNPKLNKDEMNGSLEFAKYNPTKVLFVIDSLDTLPYALDGEHDVIGLYEEASPATILWNLLTNKLLPGCRSITSSREHTIRKYEGDLRANKVIALVGLTEESMKQIIAGYLDEKEAEEIMSYLRSHHSLMSLCETPVFLVFTLIGWKYDSEFTPSTMSGIMVLLLQSLLRSSHAHAENIEDVINMLKKLAFTGTKEGRVLFQIHELAQYGLEEEEVTDVAVLAPGGRRQRLLEGDSPLFFCHQSVQETLTAFHIAEMELDEFKEFAEKNINTPHYFVVRRILTGILLDQNVFEQAQPLLPVSNLEEKRASLKNLLGQQLKQDIRNTADQIEIFISTSEAETEMKDIIANNLQSVMVSDISHSDIHAIGSVVRHCESLEDLAITQTALTPTAVKILASYLQGSNTKINKIMLDGNATLEVEGIRSVGKIIKNCSTKHVYLRTCNLSSVQMEALAKSLTEGVKLQALHIDENQQMENEGMRAIGQLVKQCNIQHLTMQYCNISATELASLNESLQGATIPNLDLTTKLESIANIESLCNLLGSVTTKATVSGGISNEEMEVELRKKVKDLSAEILIGTKNSGMYKLDLIDKKWEENLQAVTEKQDQLIMYRQLYQIGDSIKDTIAANVNKIDLRGTPLTTKDMEAIGFIVNCCHYLSLIDLCSCNLPESSIAIMNSKIFSTVKIASLLMDDNRYLGTSDVLSILYFMRRRNILSMDIPQYKPITHEDEASIKHALKVIDETTDNEHFPTTTSIGPDGERAEIDKCTITYPPGAVMISTEFKHSYSLDSSPKGFIQISPILKSEPSMRFLTPVKIKLPVWCSTNTDDVVVHVMSKDDASQPWKTMHKLKLSKLSESFIEFECDHFSWIAYFLSLINSKDVKFKLSSKLYYRKGGNFKVAIYNKKDPAKERECCDEMKYHKFDVLPIIHKFDATIGDKISVELSCDNEFQFQPDRRSFVFTDTEYMEFLLEPTPKHNTTLDLKYKLTIGIDRWLHECKYVVDDGGEARPDHQHVDPERLEDVFQDEVIKAFVPLDEFKQFARSKDGLSLSDNDVETICQDNKDFVKEQKMGLLRKWREKMGEDATPERIREIVKNYRKKLNKEE